MKTRHKALLIVAALAALLIVPTSFFTIDETELGIVTRFGAPQAKLAGPGLHLKLPWPIDDVLRVDQRLLVFDNEPAEMLTLDKKNVLVDSFLCWRVEDPLRFAQTVKTRPEAEARLLDLAVSELGAAVGSEPMESYLNPDPAQVKIGDVAARAAEKVDALARASFGIEVVDLQINGFNLPRQNRRSVIERMQAERAQIATRYRSEGEEEALKIEAAAMAEREQVLSEARASAEARRGAGEAEALRVMAEAYRKDPELYRFLRSLESYEKIIDDDTTIFIESGSELMEAFHGR